MKRTIITGATGAIGIALINECIDNDIEVLVITHRASKRNDRIPKHPLVSISYADISDLSALENDTGKTYDALFHLAWMGSAGQGRNDMYLQNDNVRYALDAVGLAERFGCKTFVGAGSQAEYGRASGILKPDTPVNPEMGYGYAKLCAGYMTREYAAQKRLKHIWARILSVYGPYDGEQSMIMSTVRKLLKGEVPKLTKGEQMWDYLYSKDAARAFRLLAEKGKNGKTYVLGGGSARPLKEYIEEIRDAAAPGAELALGAIPYGEKQVMYLCADITDLKEDTGFAPEYTFSRGIREVLDWCGK